MQQEAGWAPRNGATPLTCSLSWTRVYSNLVPRPQNEARVYSWSGRKQCWHGAQPQPMNTITLARAMNIPCLIPKIMFHSQQLCLESHNCYWMWMASWKDLPTSALTWWSVRQYNATKNSGWYVNMVWSAPQEWYICNPGFVYLLVETCYNVSIALVWDTLGREWPEKHKASTVHPAVTGLHVSVYRFDRRLQLDCRPSQVYLSNIQEHPLLLTCSSQCSHFD